MATRLEILNASLAKKQAEFDAKLEAHFSTVKQANGQPLNDKRNGRATLEKWEQQDNALRTLDASIELTKRAIEREEAKQRGISSAKDNLPAAILKRIEAGELKQWTKHPYTFFIPGVDKARIVWDPKKQVLMHRYSNEVKDPNQRKLLAAAFNTLSSELKNK